MTTTETRRAVMLQAHKEWARFSKVDPNCTFGKCLKLAWKKVRMPKVVYAPKSLAQLNAETEANRAAIRALSPGFARAARHGAYNNLRGMNERLGTHV